MPAPWRARPAADLRRSMTRPCPPASACSSILRAHRDGRRRRAMGILPQVTADGHAPYYRTIEDIYRQRWRWDKVVKGTHVLNCWYQRNCCFNVYVKDGVVLREEQAGDYPQTNASVPDFNPRGCPTGACYSHQMYHAARVLHPLKRVGERGEGKWKRVTWDEALTDIADRVVDSIVQHGPETVILDPGGSVASLIFEAAISRFANLVDATVLDTNCELG